MIHREPEPVLQHKSLSDVPWRRTSTSSNLEVVVRFPLFVSSCHVIDHSQNYLDNGAYWNIDFILRKKSWRLLHTRQIMGFGNRPSRQFFFSSLMSFSHHVENNHQQQSCYHGGFQSLHEKVTRTTSHGRLQTAKDATKKPRRLLHTRHMNKQ